MDAARALAAAAAVETPVAVVDVLAMDANIAAMQARADGLGIRLRPHAKTHKSAFVARRQLERGASGLTAATLTETELFADAGADDLLIAFPPVGAAKLRRLAVLAERVRRLAVSLDSIEVAAALPERVDVLWEVDSGHHRLGTAPEATVAAVTELIGAIGPERFRGLLTFPGHVYAVEDRAGLARVAEAERSAVMETAAALRAAGIDVAELSLGSTPTASRVEAGPTEMRPGSYVYGDAQQVALGAMSADQCALGVVATVVAIPAPERAVIDAGSKALAADARLSLLRGYGIVAGRDDLVLERMSEEHGMLVAPQGRRTRLRIGERVLVIPAHCCTTVNLHPAVLMVEAEAAWWDPVAARGWQPAAPDPGAAKTVDVATTPPG
jgi:D-serine deaminase-like pyridoxal phosphate-dependent protein